ncbi:MAG: metal-dependent hydrolase [Methanomicrobiales archaeon]|nr:metal-dependent hydrolase [Methanomicrobiales archaeon]
MFAACHLFIGLILGVAIAARLGDRRIIGFAALGGILPDLIDKPVGHILLAGSLNSGRIVAHGLLFLILLSIAGIALWRWRGSFALLAVAAGVASHQILDTMWASPVAWYFPLLGPYVPGEFTNYFGNAILAEISSLSEWIFLFASIGITLAAGYTFGRDLSGLGRTLIRMAVPLLAGLILASLYAWAVGSSGSILMAGARPGSYLVLAAAGFAGVVVIVRHRNFLGAG